MEGPSASRRSLVAPRGRPDGWRVAGIFQVVYKQFSGQLKPNKALTGCVMCQKDTT